MSAPKLLFLVTEDWFFRSHFLVLARRAVAEGYEVSIAARLSGALKGVEDVRLIDMPFARGARGPMAVAREAASLRALIARERPDVIHAIALKPIALLLLAGAADSGRVFAVTGRGFLAVRGSLWTRFMSWRLRRLLRRALAAPGAILAVENLADRRWVEGARPLEECRVALLPGAGVDTGTFTVASEPAAGPIVVGIVSRLIWSKGVDLAVEAIRRLRAGGLDIVLRIAGGIDLDNPEHVGESEIAHWRATPGVELVGRVDDINGFWAGAHIACLPSRGGEGLPRSLLEAAACGRPIVTSDAPGCADFVADGETGLVVAREDAPALAAAIRELADDQAARRRMGETARARVLQGYTTSHAADAAARAWRLASRSP